MPAERRPIPPSRVAATIGVFFTLYGVYAMFWGETQHPLYAGAAWALALVWFALAWTSRRGTRP